MKRYLDEHGPYMNYTNSLNNLHQEGYLRSFDYVEAYLPALPFNEIRKLYEREIGDLVSCLGPATLLPICLEGVYATLLREFGSISKRQISKFGAFTISNVRCTKATDGSEHPQVQVSMSELVEIYRRHGDFIQAEHFNAMVKSRRTELFGTDHPLTLACVHTEGNLFRERGSLDEAESKYKYVIEKRKQVLGTYHSGTLNALSDLGTLYLHKMEHKKAAAMLEKERDQCERLLGPNHYSTFATLNNLASVYVDMREPEAVQQLLDRSLFGLRVAYGDDHPMICTVLANHGALCYMLEDFLASRDWYSKALQSTEMILGKDHPSTMPILQSMASLFEAMDADFEDTKVLYERCIETQRRLIGENHPEFLEAQSEYCCFLLQQGHLEDAARGYRQLLLRQEETLGPKHGALMETLSNLGDALSKLGNEDAEAVLRRGLDISSQYGAGKHEIGWECMERLADYLYRTGADLNEAQDLYQEIIETKRESSNIAPLENYATLDSLASLCVDRGKLEQAIEAR
jgi:tetratricopeptide (TPR) repeat protein